MSSLHGKLEQARKELLDLTGRNRFTNYLHPTGRRGGIAVVSNAPERVFQTLVESSRAITFAPVEKDESGKLPAPVLYSDRAHQTRARAVSPIDGYATTELQTTLATEDLERRLRRMHSKAQTFIEEQGINALFVAIGALRWFESDSSAEQRIAPLVLIPVELFRNNVRTRHKIRHTGDDIGFNISLQERIRREFSITLPSVNGDDGFDVLAYMAAVTEAVATQPRWEVDKSAIFVDFFRFSKLHMYKDLDLNNWGSASKLEEHTVLSKLLGNFDFKDDMIDHGFADSDVEALRDQTLGNELQHLVVDADSTQLLAITSAIRGQNLIIQGPPGTGKSQTITNIIAEAIVHGKTVLFVAEKLAALEVVKRRLDNLGLGDACLELHSNKANKKAFLGELERTLQLGEPKLSSNEYRYRILQEERDHLDRYCRAVNTEIRHAGITPYEAYGLYLLADGSLPDVPTPPLRVPNVENLSEDEFRFRLEKVFRLQSLLASIGYLRQHPFWGSNRRVYLPSDQQLVTDYCVKAEDSVGRLKAAADSAARFLGLPPVGDCADAEKVLDVLELAASAPSLSNVALRHLSGGTKTLLLMLSNSVRTIWGARLNMRSTCSL